MQVPEGRGLKDPPLMHLENEAGRAYLSMLTTLYNSDLSHLSQGADVEARLLSFCSTTMQGFEVAFSPFRLFRTVWKLLLSIENFALLFLQLIAPQDQPKHTLHPDIVD